MTTHNDPELIDTAATHIQWLRRDGLADDHRADNEQSADYLARLSELLVLVTGRLTERAGVPPQRPEPDQPSTTDVLAVLEDTERFHDDPDMQNLAGLASKEIERLRAQRPGITRQQIEDAVERVIADEMGMPVGHAEAVAGRVLALLADSTTPADPVSWEGQTEPMLTDETPAHSNLYQLPFTPGTHVRVVALADSTTQHDHDAQLRHLIDEWGCRGVVLAVLKDLTDEQAIQLLDVVRRDVTDPADSTTPEPEGER